MKFDLTGAIALIMVFGMPMAIALGAMYFKHRKEKLWHETARLAIEKGQPIPQQADTFNQVFTQMTSACGNPTGTPQFQAGKYDRRAGLILLAAAVGLYFGMDYSPDGYAYSAYAAIPGFIGLALLANSILEVRSAKNNPAPPDPAQRP